MRLKIETYKITLLKSNRYKDTTCEYYLYSFTEHWLIGRFLDRTGFGWIGRPFYTQLPASDWLNLYQSGFARGRNS